LVLAAACSLAGPVAAQDTGRDKERALREAERQMREAEFEMQKAQKQLQEAATRMAELQAKHEVQQHKLHRYVYFGKRARLGVVVQTEADPKVDSVGAKLVAVTPGGPACEAGLEAGDIVTKIDGFPLVGSYEDLDIDDEQSGPAARLIERLSDLEDGQELELEYRRGGTLRTATANARRLFGPDVRVFVDKDVLVEPPDATEIAELDEVLVVPDVHISWDRDWLGIELVSLNSELGGYFGTGEGILVVKTPKDSGLQLRAGDVILEIDGRVPTHPSKVLRILSSYEAGETVNMLIMREKSRMTLAVKVPEHSVVMRTGAVRVSPSANPAAPARPAPPAPPAKPVKPEGSTEQL
jgi:C-terminal processing protease CtpA/Prc